MFPISRGVALPHFRGRTESTATYLPSRDCRSRPLASVGVSGEPQRPNKRYRFWLPISRLKTADRGSVR